MSNWSGNWITRRGRELLAKVGKGGNKLEFTKMKLGDGTETLDAVDELNDLVSPKLTYGISSLAQNGNTCIIVGVVSSETVSEAFQVRENGLFAKDPDLGEILFAINLDNIPDTLISAGGSSAITIQYSQNLVFTNAADVTAVIDPTGLVTTKVMANSIAAHNTAPDAHENRFTQYLPLTGGTMSGAIVVGNCPGMRKATDREETYLYGGATNQDGAAFGLRGVNCTEYGEELRGSFGIVAKSPSGETHTLSGLKDGRLLWDGKALTVRDEVIQLCAIYAGVNLLRRNHVYAVGDIAYSKNLPSWARLECVIAGTTAASEPGGLAATLTGALVIDGGVLWIADDVRDGARVGDIIIRPTLRDGYIKANGATVKASEYPRLLTWVQKTGMAVTAEQYAQDCSKYVYDSAQDKLTLPNMTGRVLQGGETVKSIEAGLPQHTHKLNGWVGTAAPKVINSGGFNVVDVATSDTSAGASNPIYGRSDTVQPPALAMIAQIKY